ncbi:MAG TPA: class I SAM-dependent methyltransferase [Solirubrobacteraceae bacterium]|nr:class I SAM-dependent methyltransferase [Solirubrobacteraceae bacterium]
MSAVAGNVYDKYATANPVARRLVGRFAAELDALTALAAPESLLDVGCGEGVLTERWARALAPARIVGVDAADLDAEWARRPATSFAVADAEALPFADGEFGLVAAIELLEHVEDPARALAELARVARSHLLVSVPREPLWRALNVARGAYVRDLGNTPGHRHHWSRRSFTELLERHGEVVRVRSPLPWTMALVRL